MEKLASKSEADFASVCEVSRKIMVLPILAVVICHWGVSGSVDMEIMGTVVELNSFLKRTCLGALVFSLRTLEHF